eukprot:CAMPEP_0118715154 /NCGR_PEP_ID=MMETSP0800-20121206/26691_1 /TAXON_ID=210618 ORGANISM="Striatella unipunctata, Strain CCMP2910" /NCGR_SAMPLE_ID=MMETSP0800 /ASSEMBLY_ACC=CAM_ASM_000638 /LENGTH=902 /DNA_ID=CAMNT_0006621239 /DNA_START=79 /DNA_END=2787 /DNA_ORIENTATION=-
MPGCVESFGDTIDQSIAGFFKRIGSFVGSRPRLTIFLAILLTIFCGGGFVRWETENRGEKLWVPQDTTAEQETEDYQSYFASTSRFNTMLISPASGDNILTKGNLEEAMKMHLAIETGVANVDGIDYALADLCTKSGGTCASKFDGVCQCLVSSILRQWNYDLATLQSDDNFLETLAGYGSMDDLKAVLGQPTFDPNDALVSAEAFTLSYFLVDREVVVAGTPDDPINEGWEEDVFLAVVESVPETYPALVVNYFAARSFEDEFGGAISGDLGLVQISYVVVFLFLAATLGKIRPGPGSRWTMSLGALFMVVLSTAACFGLSSAFGLFFGPVHSILPFILLGIGVDDAFVIVNAFNRERKGPRTGETNEQLAKRSALSLARAGASITVTSATDLVAFGISSSSRLPALSSFCAYAAIGIFFLWLFSATFFTGALVLDERRQRDNRRECLCCVTRGKPLDESQETYQEDIISKYFRNYHGPAVLSSVGKIVVLVIFGALLAFGIYGAMNLSVEDSERNFIPAGSYLNDYFDASDAFFPDQGIDMTIVFQGSTDIYNARTALSELDTRLTGLSTAPPYISEPVSEEAYRNVMDGFAEYLSFTGTAEIGGVSLGGDGWPATEADFVSSLKLYAANSGPGSKYARDVSFSEDGTKLEAFKVQTEYVRLTKVNRGTVIDDADKQIDAMDTTRDLIASWTDLPQAFPYSDKFISIEGFKIIRREFFQNVALALLAVGVIVLFTVASPGAAMIITLVVLSCIIDILGFMYALGVVIDSVSVINLVLAVGLSVDYSAHVGHCFMTKGGDDKNRRALESLADIGAAVLSGALSTFLAVAILLFSSSYVFEVLSTQFALTVGFGIIHGLVLLPVLLSILGPKPFSSAEPIDGPTEGKEEPAKGKDDEEEDDE